MLVLLGLGPCLVSLLAGPILEKAVSFDELKNVANTVHPIEIGRERCHGKGLFRQRDGDRASDGMSRDVGTK